MYAPNITGLLVFYGAIPAFTLVLAMIAMVLAGVELVGGRQGRVRRFRCRLCGGRFHSRYCAARCTICSEELDRIAWAKARATLGVNCHTH